MKKVNVYIDESGNIDINHRSSFFIIAGFYTLDDEKHKIKRNYKETNKLIKEESKIDLKTELKGRDLTFEQRFRLLNSASKSKAFKPFALYVDKKEYEKYCEEKINMKDQKIFLQTIIVYLFKKIKEHENGQTTYLVDIDHINNKKNRIKSIEDRLKGEFISTPFIVNFVGSETNYCIQLADIIANSFLVELTIESGKDIRSYKGHQQYEKYGKKILSLIKERGFTEKFKFEY